MVVKKLKIVKYKKFNILITKITSKTSPYILPSEKPRFITYIGNSWLGTYSNRISALKNAKDYINDNPNLLKYKAFLGIKRNYFPSRYYY